MDAGYAVLRVKQIDKSISITRMNELLDAILIELDNISDKFPTRKKRLIEIEVANGKTKRISG